MKCVYMQFDNMNPRPCRQLYFHISISSGSTKQASGKHWRWILYCVHVHVSLSSLRIFIGSARNLWLDVEPESHNLQAAWTLSLWTCIWIDAWKPRNCFTHLVHKPICRDFDWLMEDITWENLDKWRRENCPRPVFTVSKHVIWQ